MKLYELYYAAVEEEKQAEMYKQPKKQATTSYKVGHDEEILREDTGMGGGMGGTGKKTVNAANRNKAQEKKVQEQARLEREKKAAQLKAAAASGKD